MHFKNIEVVLGEGAYFQSYCHRPSKHDTKCIGLCKEVLDSNFMTKFMVDTDSEDQSKNLLDSKINPK